MAKEKNKIHPLNMAMQLNGLGSIMNKSIIKFNQNSLQFEYIVTPSPLSAVYKIKVEYTRGLYPEIYVIEPQKLKLFPGRTTLPHVYSTSQQRLCLFYRKSREWNSSMYLSNSIIPWTSEWLLHYECWLATGEWHGGGIHVETEIKKQMDQDYEINTIANHD